MKTDFFTQLEVELAGLTRDGVHVRGADARGHRRLALLIRRGLVIIALAIALAASLDSEFPATASGRAPVSFAVVQSA